MRKHDGQDFSRYLSQSGSSKKQKLIIECKSNHLSIFLDDSSETAESTHTMMRPIASEAELERRLNAHKAIYNSKIANAIAILALLFSIATLLKTYL